MSLEADILKLITESGYRLTAYISDEVATLVDIVEDENAQLDEDDDNFRDDDEAEYDDEDGDEPLAPASD
jgi:hypothetical protein